MVKKINKKMLLHCCCAPCAAYVVSVLEKDYNLTLFFYNPNIHPGYEYENRLHELKKFADMKNMELISGEYDMKNWFSKTAGREEDTERGERCRICYDARLRKTAEFAKENSFDFWSTTLTISPHKSAEMINKIGLDLEKEFGTEFLSADFKKKDGFKKSLDMSRQYDFYRQNYCGCLYSQVGRVRVKSFLNK
ncbi:MAG: epoxyqueuosine reductase QueH [bacterium]